MRGILSFVNNMKEIKFVSKLQRDPLKVLCSIFEKLVTVQKENQVLLYLWLLHKCDLLPSTSRIFVANGDIKIRHIDTQEHIIDIFANPLDPDIFGCLRYKLNVR